MRRFALVALAVAAAGCGAERREAPATAAPAPVTGLDPLVRGDVRVELPVAWTTTAREAPLLALSRSGSATIALWRYERTEELPRTDAELRAARRRLVDAARVRDPSFAVRRTRSLRLAGAPAVQVVGDETIDGRRRRVRSTHVYADGAELVVDAYAAPEHFAAADAAAFRPVLRSLRLELS
jgi:hypothetical protein